MLDEFEKRFARLAFHSFTMKEAAEITGISMSTLRGMTLRGQLAFWWQKRSDGRKPHKMVSGWAIMALQARMTRERIEELLATVAKIKLEEEEPAAEPTSASPAADRPT